MKINMLLILMISIVLSGCSDSSDNKVSGVAKPYQEKLTQAWQEASQGKSPAMTCLYVGAAAVQMVAEGKDKNDEARQAFEACYVDAFVHYANVLFSQDNSADTKSTAFITACTDFRRNLRGGLLTAGNEYADKLNIDLDDLNKKVRAGLLERATLCPGHDQVFD